jgi:hypothetical protein
MPIAFALPPPAFVAACATSPRGKVLVTAGIDKWDIGPTVDTAELNRMAKETGAQGRHPAYGFYIGAVAYAVTAEIGNAANDICQGPIFIHVTMRLTNRHIGVANDIPAGSCRFARITAHYRHHADADEAVFQHYVLEVTAVLSRTRMSALMATAGAGAGPAHIPEAVATVIEPVMSDMDAARKAARMAVDTPGEIEKLGGPCDDSL